MAKTKDPFDINLKDNRKAKEKYYKNKYKTSSPGKMILKIDPQYKSAGGTIFKGRD